jgi:ABC-type transport system involved in multi-copper enzyme maturation permease subunit
MDGVNWMSYLLRLIMLATLGLCVFSAQMRSNFGHGIGLAAPGLMLCQSVFFTNIVFIIALAAGFFATAITEEKESESLPLLLMTGVSPTSILIGKAASKLIFGVLLILCQLPFMMLAVTLGGVLLAHIFTAYVVLLCYMFMLCSLGLLCSTVCMRSSSAGFLTLGLAISSMVFHDKLELFGVDFLFPFADIDSILSVNSKASILGTDSLFQLGAGLAFLLLARVLFNRFSRAWTPPLPFLKRLRSFKGSFGRRLMFFVGRPKRDAIFWKDFNFFYGGWRTAILLSSILAGCVCFIVYISDSLEPLNAAMISVFVVGLAAFAIQSLYVAGSFWANEAWEGSLQQLVVLPSTFRSMTWSKLKAGALFCVPSIVFAIAGGAALLYIDGLPPLRWDDPSDVFSFSSLIVSQTLGFVMFLHLVAFISLLVKHGVIIVAPLIYLFVQFAIGVPIMFAIGILTMREFISGEMASCFYQVVSAMAFIILILILRMLFRWRLRVLVERSCA